MLVRYVLKHGRCTLKMLGYICFNPNAGFSLLGHFIRLFLIFLPRCWVQPVGSFYRVVFNIFTQVLGSACWVILSGCFSYFYPGAGVSLLGHFIGLFLIF